MAFTQTQSARTHDSSTQYIVFVIAEDSSERYVHGIGTPGIAGVCGNAAAL